MPLRFFCSLYSVLLWFSVRAQDYSWWNDVHDWDGVTSWQEYLTLAPAYMGPNALPVPPLSNGALNDTPSFHLAADAHFGGGDDTQNLYGELHLPLYSDRVALNIRYVPLEHYRMDEATRDKRAARDFDGRGFASGDLYLGTRIQLLRDHARLPDLLLSINLRTASGNKLAAARFTDTPGYYFDLSAGKTYRAGDDVSLRPHLMAGFYVWQTFRDDYYQNDAAMYGGGMDAILPGVTVTTSLAGYYGYIGEGDRPLVCRLAVRRINEGRLGWNLRLQRGIADFPYTSLRIGLIWSFRAPVHRSRERSD